MKMPRFDQLMLPVMQALVNLGGSGSTHEIYEEVIKLGKFDDSILDKPHNPEKGNFFRNIVIGELFDHHVIIELSF